MNEPLLNELQQEAKSTRRLLERVPADKLAWSPHPKSMTLGALAIHIARLPGGMTRVAQLPQFDVSTPSPPVAPENADEILAAFDKSIEDASAYLAGLSPETAGETWRLVMKDKELLSIPRAAMLRTLLLNHMYHHRGQLSVYLRLLDVPLPVIYGRSADEGPM